MSPDRLSTRLAAMKRNPRAGWGLEDVSTLCKELGIRCSVPYPGAACCAISHRRAEGFLTLPAGRPLKALYVMLFLQLVESVVDAR